MNMVSTGARPVDMVDILGTEDVGITYLINFQYAYDNGTIDKNILKSYIQECNNEFMSQTTSMQRKMTKAQNIINIMMMVADRNFSQYLFCSKMNCMAHERVSRVITHMMLFDGEYGYLSAKTLSNGAVTIGGDFKDEHYFRYLCDLCAYKNAIVDGRPVRGRRPYAWIVPSHNLEEQRKAVRSAGHPVAGDRRRAEIQHLAANRVRDYLGLCDYGRNTVIIALHYPKGILKKVQFAAPTVIEAGDHSRFRARIGVPTPDNWGRTVDLRKLADRKAEIEGAPEAVVKPVIFSSAFRCEVIGRITEDPPDVSNKEFVLTLNDKVDVEAAKTLMRSLL